MKQLGTMLTSYDIRCNAIAPGLYLSEVTEPLYKAQGWQTGIMSKVLFQKTSFRRQGVETTRIWLVSFCVYVGEWEAKSMGGWVFCQAAQNK